MKTRAISVAVATLMSLQSAGWAQPSRVDGIGDQEIAQAQQEIAILRHDLNRLDQALAATEIALHDQQKQPKTNVLYLTAAGAGVGVAAMAATTALLRKNPVAAVAVPTSIAAAIGLVHKLSKEGGPADSAAVALTKARQEILVARATSKINPQSVNLLMELDKSLETMQSAVKAYKDRAVLDKRLQLAALVSQAAGLTVALTLATGIVRNPGLSKAGLMLAPLLMTSGNIAGLVNYLIPSKADQVLGEIGQTRTAIANALKQL